MTPSINFLFPISPLPDVERNMMIGSQKVCCKVVKLKTNGSDRTKQMESGRDVSQKGESVIGNGADREQ